MHNTAPSLGWSVQPFFAIHDFDVVMARDDNIGIAPVINNGVQQDILIAISITLGIQHLSDDICGQFFGTAIREANLVDLCV